MARSGRTHIFNNFVSEIKTFAVVVVVLFFALRTFSLFALGFHTLHKPKLFLGEISQLHYGTKVSGSSVPAKFEKD